MKRGNLFTIENKILIPFVSITLVAIACLFVVFYHMEYKIKLETEGVNARALVAYINADIDVGGYWQNPGDLLEKYEQTYQGEDLFVYDRDGTLLFGRRPVSEDELVLQDNSDNRLGWRIVCSMDRQTLNNAFIDEQHYVILGAVAMLLIIVQCSVLVAYHISGPISELSQLCTRISRVPEHSEDLVLEYTHRRDEVGELAAAFQSMMERLRDYTDELSWVKALNESIVENLPIGVVVWNGRREVIFRNARAEAMLAQTGEVDEQGRDLRTILNEMARNPLAGIRAGLQVVGRKLTDQRDQMLCREMLREVDRVNLLVENLLNVSRKRESEKTTVALNALSEEIGMLYDKVAENKGVTLSIEMEEDLWVLADEQELRQILINLINNSIKALSNGGKIILHGRCGAEGVTVMVEDDGPGMEQAKLDRALRGEDGGLGLPIVLRLAEQNGGRLRFETGPGQGTRAVLTFHGTGGISHEV